MKPKEQIRANEICRNLCLRHDTTAICNADMENETEFLFFFLT